MIYTPLEPFGHSHLPVLAYVGLWLLPVAGSACLWLRLFGSLPASGFSLAWLYLPLSASAYLCCDGLCLIVLSYPCPGLCARLWPPLVVFAFFYLHGCCSPLVAFAWLVACLWLQPGLALLPTACLCLPLLLWLVLNCPILPLPWSMCSAVAASGCVRLLSLFSCSHCYIISEA